MTNFLTYQERLDYIVLLAQKNSTGTLEQLAYKFRVS